jgi:iron complex outermembrane receptor protein
LSSTPRHLFSIWGDYTISDGALRGLGFGSGVRYTGTSFGNDRNSFKNDARGIVDAEVHYDLAGLDAQFAGARLQLNVSNVFDKLVDTCSSDYCYQDQGRTILGSLRYRW